MLDRTTTLDTPDAYDAAERAAMARLPNRVIEAARAVAFQAVGYPTRISDLRELWRYADVMQEGRLKPTFDAIGGLTEHEFELVKLTTAYVYAATDNLCDHPVVPGAALIRAIPVYRAIKAKYPTGCSVFELGAGSGYVGALLQADNFNYQTSDIAQAFALWQMHLLGTDTVIPWWKWVTTGPAYSVKVFNANHMLNEMHPHALMHTAKTAKRMLEGDGVFLVEDFGSTVLRDAQATCNILGQYGIKPTMVSWPNDLARPIQWDDMVKWWTDEYDGVPKSDDEKFLESLAP